MSVLRTLLFTGCLTACGLMPAWAQTSTAQGLTVGPREVHTPSDQNLVNDGTPSQAVTDPLVTQKYNEDLRDQARESQQKQAQQPVADPNAPRTGSMAVPPPAPGGAPMVDGQIPPISADMLALTPEEQQEMAMQEARGKAFDATLKNALPLEPSEIQSVIKRYEDTTKAVETPFGNVDPKPEVKIETISLEPSATPPTIRLAPGHVTSLTMLDATGQPWPVADVSWGGDFEVQAPEDGGHIIRISPLGGYKTGNMSLRLQDLTTPVTFTLKTQPDIVDYRFDARLPIPGPNALAAVIDTSYTGQAGSGDLMTILDGVPPREADILGVSGVDGRTSAYRAGGKIFVRTPLSMLSPAWSEQATSADGMKVYVIQETPVLLLSDQGRMVRANIELGAASASQPTAATAAAAAMVNKLSTSSATTTEGQNQ